MQHDSSQAALSATLPHDHGLSPKQAAAELLRRRRMRESLIAFAQNITIPMAPSDGEEDADENLLKPIGFGIAAHHLLLMQKLQKHMTRRYGRLMVFMPPGAAKSTYCSVVAPTWYMGNNPDSQLILCSYNTPLAKKHGGRARNIVQQPNFKGAFNCTIDGGSTAKELWQLTNGSEYMSSGLTSGITGNRAWGVILDDPIRGRADAESPTILAKTIGAYEDDLMTRLVPGAWIILMQTRWTHNDIPGRILGDDYDFGSGMYTGVDGMEWEVLNLPAKHEWPDLEDPLGRPANGPGLSSYLWPEWFDERHWQQYEHIPDKPNSPSARRWYSLFQQRPRPSTGNKWERGWIHWFKDGEQPEWLMYFLASDFAVTDPNDVDARDFKPDFTEHGIAGLDEHGGLWIVDWWYGQRTTDITIPAMLDLAKTWGVRNGFGESGIIRRAIEPQIKYWMRKKQYRMHIEYLPYMGEKVAKFEAFRGLGAGGLVHVMDTPWGRRIEDRLVDFPDRGKDDTADVCANFGRATESMVWSKARCQKKKKPGLQFGSWEWICAGSDDGKEIQW